ncbi:MAG: hypothetical protein QN229_00170 [Desulfurococcaceae archaeon TW002]
MSIANEGGEVGLFKWFSGFIGKIKGGSKVDPKKFISLLIVHVDSAKQEVSDTVARLKSRYDHLVKATISASIGKEKDRALIYANEATQVREMTTKLVVVEKVLEQVKLRLETLEDVSNLSHHLIEVSNLLVVAKDYVKDLVPNLAYNIDSLINESRRVIASTTDYAKLKPEEIIEHTPEAKKLLQEIEKAAEETIKSQLPEIPVDILLPVKVKGNLEEKIKKDVEAITLPSKQPDKFKTIDQNLLEKALLEYIVTHNGFVDVNHFKNMFGVSKEDVYKALNRLREQNKIVF